jgi:hypothetical protein
MRRFGPSICPGSPRPREFRLAIADIAPIGLPAGEIFVKHLGGDGSETDVAWQCTFADAAAREADLAARAASAAFESIRVQMRKPLVRFERQVFSIRSQAEL